MPLTKQEKLLASAFLVVAVIIILALLYRKDHGAKSSFASCASCGGGSSRASPSIRRGEWSGGRGPYNLQLYDSPHYYPYYESKDVMNAWDGDGRCVSYCRASDDGGCAVACR